MWSGTTVPDGWALCDGTPVNGITPPNLSGRFIVGYNPLNPSYNQPGNLSELGSTAGNTGGNDLITLTVDNLPTHAHDAGQLITQPAGIHSHDIGYDKVTGPANNSSCVTRINSDLTSNIGNTYPSGEHTHQITGTTHPSGGTYFAEVSHIDNTGEPNPNIPKASCPDYQNLIASCNGDNLCITITDNMYNAGYLCVNPNYNPNYGTKVIDSPEHWDVQPFDNRPAYYVLAFIMRIR
jgi:hypothetical protein